jgi:hypothetical protein
VLSFFLFRHTVRATLPFFLQVHFTLLYTTYNNPVFTFLHPFTEIIFGKLLILKNIGKRIKQSKVRILIGSSLVISCIPLKTFFQSVGIKGTFLLDLICRERVQLIELYEDLCTMLDFRNFLDYPLTFISVMSIQSSEETCSKCWPLLFYGWVADNVATCRFPQASIRPKKLLPVPALVPPILCWKKPKTIPETT